LWEEFVFSNEGQNAFLEGYCQPIRLSAMREAGTASAAVLARTPDTTKTQLPTGAQIDAAYNVVSDNWSSVVGVTIK
jgi:putative spermidine/putrescine transport system substrate-binding protein